MNLPPRRLATSALGSEIRAARRCRKLTQKALASLAKIDLATLRNLESGRGTVTSLVSVLSALQHSFLEQPNELPLGCWLKSHRKLRKFSQRKLCETSEVSKPSVIQIERGHGNVATLTAIMTAAGLSVTLRPNEGSAPSGSVWRNGVLRRLRREFTAGDCLDVMPTFEAGSIDLIVTSPPYNRGKVYGSCRDNLSLPEYRAFAQAWLAAAVPLLSEKGSLWINLGNTKDPDGGTLPLDHLYLPLIKDLGLKLVQRIVWDHCTAKPQVSKFTQVHECWLWCARRAKGYTWDLDPVRVPPKTSFNRTNPFGANPTDVWRFPSLVHNAKARPDHPCPFPIEIIERIILACSRLGDLVLDPFGGAGTTALAAARHGRGFVSIEIASKYHRVSIERLKAWEMGKGSAAASALPSVPSDAQPVGTQSQAQVSVEPDAELTDDLVPRVA